jgi:hypothetical protein
MGAECCAYRREGKCLQLLVPEPEEKKPFERLSKSGPASFS